MKEMIEEERREDGLDLIQIKGAPGYQMEHILITRSSTNRLRIEIMDDGDDHDRESSDGWWGFQITSKETAELIAAKLLEFAAKQFP